MEELEDSKLKIMSWNINGLRASKVHYKNLIQSQSCDIVCFQETKLTRDQLDEDTAIIEGYNSYYSCSRKRSGYSGVATICKDSCTPVSAEEGLSSILQAKLGIKDVVGHYGDYEHFTTEELNALDSEGRALITLHKIRLPDQKEAMLAIINVYCPRGGCENEDRQRFKLRFYELLELRANAIRQSGSHVIIVGDINTSHKLIDTCRELADGEEFPQTDSRQWLDQFLSTTDITGGVDGSGRNKEHHFVDTFRHFYPDWKEAYTCWCTTTGARSTNYGTRLDYILADNILLESAFVDSTILPDVRGSDHCPVVGDLRCQVIAAPKPPKLCTKFYPEFSGKQQKLVSFFSKKTSSVTSIPENSTKSQGVLIVQNANSCSRKRTCAEPMGKSCKVAKSTSQKKLTSFFAPPKVDVCATNGIKESVPTHNNSAEKTDRGDKLSEASCSSQTDNVSPSQEDDTFDVSKKTKSANASLLWKNVFQAPKAPNCKGHDEPCVLRTVKKVGPTCGRQFYVCARPEGLASNPEARCDFFQWKKKS